MQLDRVRRNPVLAVVEVEERDSGDARPGAEPDFASHRGYLSAPVRRRPSVTVGRWRFGDHVVAALNEHEVEIVVGFLALEHNPRHDGEDVPLERQPRVGQRARRWPGDR